MRNCDQVEIIESAYALGVPDAQWQYRLTDLVADRWGGAAASFLYDLTSPNLLVCERVVVRTAGERSIVDSPQSIPLGDPALRRALFCTRPHLAQLVDLLSPELVGTADSERVLDIVRDLHPGPFPVVLRTLDPSQKGVFFVLPSRPIGVRMRAMWGQVAVHVGLAYRVRSALASASDSVDRSRADADILRQALRQEWPRMVSYTADQSYDRAGKRDGEVVNYSLGLSVSEIAEHVATLANKYGTSTPADIVRWLGARRDPRQGD